MTVVFLTSGTSWTVPADWNSANNTIEAIGGGGGGGGGGEYSSGGGGGAYAKKNNVSLTPSASVSYQIGQGGARSAAGTDTWFSSTSVLLAKAGGFSSGASGGIGGPTATSVGDVKYAGGAGGPSTAWDTMGGGGGAGGPAGAGAAGIDEGLNPTGANGANGTEWDSTHGAGGGGHSGYTTAGNGGNYGGGGGGYGDPAGGLGTQGIIVINYTPVSSDFTLTAATGAFTLTGSAAPLLKTLKLSMSAGDFTLTGADVVLKKGRTLTGETGVFTLTGVAVGLKTARKLTAAEGSFTFTGKDASFRRGWTLVAETGSFILSGANANLSSTATGNAPISQRGQQSEVGIFVELFTLDATALGGGIEYWTPSRPTISQPILWGGHNYLSVDIKIEGIGKTTKGTLPRPQLAVGNADNILGAILTIYKDLLGCVVTRTKTLYEYLDDQPGADPEQYWPVDIFRVERKVSQNKNKVVLELATATDNVGAKIPKGVVIRDTCSLLYRRYVNGVFVYTDATCPYTGTPCYNKDGDITIDANDVCGKRLSDCRKRFGIAELPFGGFPGVAKVKL